MGRILGRMLLWMLMVAAAVYVVDWAVWQVRVLRGKGYGSVHVGKLEVFLMKDNKEGYFPDGEDDVRCSVSLLPQGVPQAGMKPCWWMRKHPTVFER